MSHVGDPIGQSTFMDASLVGLVEQAHATRNPIVLFQKLFQVVIAAHPMSILFGAGGIRRDRSLFVDRHGE